MENVGDGYRETVGMALTLQTLMMLRVNILKMCVLQGLIELMQQSNFCSCGPCLCCCFQYKKADEIEFILQVTFAALKRVPLICSCSVCLGGSKGVLISADC